MSLRLQATLRLITFSVTAILLATCRLAPIGLAAHAPVTIATANLGAIYHPVGNAVCRIVNLANDDASATRCQAIASDGAVTNVARVRSGAATLGLTQSDLAYAAFRGEGLFTPHGADRALRSVAALHRESFTVIARAEAAIHNFEDLRGKRIGIGKTGAGYSFTRDVVLEFYGWTISAFDRARELGPAEQNQTLCNNEVDAIIFEAAHPDGLTQLATSECRARLVPVAGLPIERLLTAHPYYVASIIPGGLYEGNPQDTPTFGTQTLLVTSAQVPDDLVYSLVRALFENIGDFQHLHPALWTLTRQDMVPSEAVMPIHAGALGYYREIGLVR